MINSCRAYTPVVRRSEWEDDEIGQIVCSANALEDHSLLRARTKLDLALEVRAGASNAEIYCTILCYLLYCIV